MRQNIQGENIIYRDNYHINPNMFIEGKSHVTKQYELEYKNILQDSVFSLCPRGSSPSSVRFWESLQAGAIPILISDNWILPEWDWKNTILRIPEENITHMTYYRLHQQLSDIKTNRINELMENCIKASIYFSKNNIGNYIRSKYECYYS
jgi:hypothetical protein